MIRVTAPSRLHFGLFRLPVEQDTFWPDLDNVGTIPARNFGGVGLMIDRPKVRVCVAPAKAWSASGPLAARALSVAQQFLSSTPEFAEQSFAITVEACAPEHVGLGTGTQLGLAVARAVAVALGRHEWDTATLAARIGRGQRSGIGVHGFQHGGFLVDGGKLSTTRVAPLIARHDFPEEWAVLLILPRGMQGVHDKAERDAFAHLSKSPSADRQTEALCRLVLLAILPALVERDLDTFGAALYDFNRRVGEMFRPWQGGTYANPRTAELLDFFRGNGVRAAGQTSWGPTVFAIGTADGLARLAMRSQERFGLARDEVVVCSGANRGARVVKKGTEGVPGPAYLG